MLFKSLGLGAQALAYMGDPYMTAPGTNYGTSGPAMPPEHIYNSYEDAYRYNNPGKPVPSNGNFTKDGCYIWEPKPGTLNPYTQNDGKPIEIVFC